MGVKMVLSGEGADEIFGGYLYFHKAPNEQEFFEETRDKVRSPLASTSAMLCFIGFLLPCPNCLLIEVDGEFAGE